MSIRRRVVAPLVGMMVFNGPTVSAEPIEVPTPTSTVVAYQDDQNDDDDDGNGGLWGLLGLLGLVGLAGLARRGQKQDHTPGHVPHTEAPRGTGTTNRPPPGPEPPRA